MHIHALRIWLACILLASFVSVHAQEGKPSAEFLFVGSFHMSNPGRDVHNIKSDDMSSPKRQAQIREVVRLLKEYRPTRVFVERDTTKQPDLDRRFRETCHEGKPLGANETEQLALRIACDLKLPGAVAVDWNDLGPIKDEDSINYLKAVERHGQQARYQENLRIGERVNQQDQETLVKGTVLDMLRRLNSSEWLEANAQAYFRIGLLGTPEDPVGANWVQSWYGRNLAIFNNIVRGTQPGDRVLVIYGAGHGNLVRQLARDSGRYRVHDPLDWLKLEGSKTR